MAPKIRPPQTRGLFYLLFALSGFSGLIYESIWSHYLKLFLGHAAYAQSLVLVIFMGGMALGAWLASRYSQDRKNLLLAYAFVEGAIGVYALIFHGAFVRLTDFAYATLIPNLNTPWAIDLLKWTLSAALILIPSILLGATFPLMSAGILRRFPDAPGASLAMLYFTNSLGAAIGVLVSGFLLIALVGLPGTLLTAGIVNILLAIVVWGLVRNTPEKPLPDGARATGERVEGWRLLLVVAFLTGAASFIYEIGWIRMLTLVLGASTHAFELMLSAFISGLAFGGLAIRRRIDHTREPLRLLGIVQIVMGFLAMATLVGYNTSFDVMHAIMQALARTPDGYRVFNIASHAIALGIMFPATFFAGMTLPLITHALLRRNYGEKSIGAVYAANTLGAIFGVTGAVHIGLPLLGLKGLVAVGATIDVALGIVLLYHVIGLRSWLVPGAIAAAGTLIIAIVGGIEFDQYKMASGVYRHGILFKPGSGEILFHRDGKTATVDVVRDRNGGISILTNGKSDALINASDTPPAPDEATMTLLGALPLLLHAHPRAIANIGFGSGLTAHVLLASPDVEQLDIVEIEPAMVEGARRYGARVTRAYTDPRARDYIDDAKTFFAAHRARYDIIVSEPSNPWVSGVSGLFSDEFYQRARTHLKPGGLFVQWLQVYEIDLNLVGSIIKAIEANFDDYVLYAANEGDIIVVARVDGSVAAPKLTLLRQPAFAEELRRIGVGNEQDLALRRIGDRDVLWPLFASLPVAVNSDYFPVLDLNAARTRFLQSRADDVTRLAAAPLPVLEMLAHAPGIHDATDITPTVDYSAAARANRAMWIRDQHIARAPKTSLQALPADMARHLVVINASKGCSSAAGAALWLDSVYQLTAVAFSHLTRKETETLSEHWRSSPCYTALAPEQREAFALFRAVGRRDASNMSSIAERLLARTRDTTSESGAYALGAGMLGYLAQDRPDDALRLWSNYGSPTAERDKHLGLLFPLLWAHSVYRQAPPGATRPRADRSDF
ncbi:MAG: spermidine synthase [Sulfurifustis sp.]